MTAKILVAYHKPSLLFKDEILMPVNGGRDLAKQKFEKGSLKKEDYEWLLNNTVGDDSGDNISSRNSTFNEMSIIYWAWKNYAVLGDPDYIGLCHYRRFFLFKEGLEKKDPRSWTYDIPSVESGSNFLDQIGYSKEKIKELTAQYDCIVGTAQTDSSVMKQYCISTGQYKEDIDFAFEYINKNYPEMKEAATSYFAGSKQYFCNMFILQKNLFFKYCEFIFPVLFSIDEKNSKDELRSAWEKRLFISERLTGVFINYLIQENKKIKELPIALLGNTDLKEELFPKFQDKTAIVFSVDRNYLPYLQVTVISLLRNISTDNRYDIIIMYDDLNASEQNEFLKGLPSFPNVSVRFFNVSSYIDTYKKEFYIEIHVTISTYYRFFIEDVFKNFNRVIYLDSDIVINDDIAKLANYPLNGHVIGAAHDVREVLAGKLDLVVSKNINWKKYLTNTLKLNNWENYFQAGVLIFDVIKAGKIGLKGKLIKKLHEIKTPILSDQDVLNAVCQNDVEYFPVAWNVEWQIPLEFPEYEKILPGKFEKEYISAYKNPKIMHYASPKKPWHTDIRTPSAYLWWNYAKHSSYIHRLEREWLDKKILEIYSSKQKTKFNIHYYLPNHRANRRRWVNNLKKIMGLTK